jgi:hypothetical protein
MSQERKVMKVLALVMFAWAVVMLVLDVVGIVVAAGEGFGAGSTAYIVLDTCAALFGIWIFMKGVQGANTPSKAGPFIKACIIMCVYQVLYIAFSLFMGGLAAITRGDVVFGVLALVICLAGWRYGKAVLEASLNK